MDDYQETFETWNKIAALYQDKFMDMNLYNESYDLFCQLLDQRSGANILEIGCGPGNITRYLIKKRPDFQIEGIDIASNMIELARHNNPTATFQVMDSRDIDTLDRKFDAIICGFCLPYMSQPDASRCIKNCHQLLNEEGILYLSFVEGAYEQSGYQTGSSGDRTYFYYYNLEDLKSELNKGFDGIHTIHIPYNKSGGRVETHTILIVKKSDRQPWQV